MQPVRSQGAQRLTKGSRKRDHEDSGLGNNPSHRSSQERLSNRSRSGDRRAGPFAQCAAAATLLDISIDFLPPSLPLFLAYLSPHPPTQDGKTALQYASGATREVLEAAAAAKKEVTCMCVSVCLCVSVCPCA